MPPPRHPWPTERYTSRPIRALAVLAGMIVFAICAMLALTSYMLKAMY